MPDLALDILTVGENTGNLVNSLREITKIYRRELTRYLQILTAVISSAALIFAFILVTIIALSIIFSVFQVSNSLSV
jgi:general secretion pathway protein F